MPVTSPVNPTDRDSANSPDLADAARPVAPSVDDAIDLEDLEGLDPADLEAIAERLAAASKDEPTEEAPEKAPEEALDEAPEEPLTEPPAAESEPDADSERDRKAEAAAQLYLGGRSAFESGYYRQAIAQLEKAAALSVKASPIGGEIQIWLVTAYQARGNLDAAQALCRKLTRHPNIETRQKSRRLLAILEAPRLAMRSEWLSEIPDLSKIEESEDSDKKGTGGTYKPRPIRKLAEPEIDPSTIVRGDNQFIWVAIAAILAVLFLFARTA